MVSADASTCAACAAEAAVDGLNAKRRIKLEHMIPYNKKKIY